MGGRLVIVLLLVLVVPRIVIFQSNAERVSLNAIVDLLVLRYSCSMTAILVSAQAQVVVVTLRLAQR